MNPNSERVGTGGGVFWRIATVVLAVSAMSATTVAQAQPRHPCAADAVAKAAPLLKLHFESDNIESMSIDDSVKVLPPIRALKGNGRFDVIEVWGHIYKADYRMRFIYAQIRGSCVLMGQEILEASNPY